VRRKGKKEHKEIGRLNFSVEFPPGICYILICGYRNRSSCGPFQNGPFLLQGHLDLMVLQKLSPPWAPASNVYFTEIARRALLEAGQPAPDERVLLQTKAPFYAWKEVRQMTKKSWRDCSAEWGHFSDKTIAKPNVLFDHQKWPAKQLAEDACNLAKRTLNRDWIAACSSLPGLRSWGEEKKCDRNQGYFCDVLSAVLCLLFRVARLDYREKEDLEGFGGAHPGFGH